MIKIRINRNTGESFLLRLQELILGKDYILSFGGRRSIKVRFIKTTRKGYNFLELKTSKCLIKNHLYPDKHYSKKDNNFFVPDKLTIKEL